MSHAENPIHIRPAAPADVPRLTEIAFAAKRHWGYPEGWLERWREALTVIPGYVARGTTFVAAVDAEIVGFGALEFAGAEATIEHLWVLPDWMGRGIGRRLFAHAEALARARGATGLMIESDPHAEAFYRRMGATTIGRTPAHMDGVERYLPVMRKDLARG